MNELQFKNLTKKQKWRGIKTTQKKINETKAKTIINRLGQKSISLPRIDDKKRWAGYPSLAGTAEGISNIIPKSFTYVEAFAGTAKVFQELNKKKYTHVVLNDKSKFIYRWLKKEFSTNSKLHITNLDFKNCISKWDNKKTFFLFDMPYYKSYYDQAFSCFDRKSVKDYNIEILKFCERLKGTFLITTRKENHWMLNSGFYNYVIKSVYVLCGHFPEVLLTTNFIIPQSKRISNRIKITV